jgi:uracil-DNA glycosylase
VVVGLGERAYRGILRGFQMTCGPFRSEVEAPKGRVLPTGSRAFAVYHCGARIRNTHRPMAAQREDWKRLRPFLDTAGYHRIYMELTRVRQDNEHARLVALGD